VLTAACCAAVCVLIFYLQAFDVVLCVQTWALAVSAVSSNPRGLF
jgi:hypothetical protein